MKTLRAKHLFFFKLHTSMPDINYCSIIIAEIIALFSASCILKTHYLTVLPVNELISQMKCGTVVLFDSNYSLHLNNVLRVTVSTDMWRMLIDCSTPRDWGETALYQQFSHPCDYINHMCVYQCMCVIEREGTADCEFSRHVTIWFPVQKIFHIDHFHY